MRSGRGGNGQREKLDSRLPCEELGGMALPLSHMG
jgi:hypothetical protein